MKENKQQNRGRWKLFAVLAVCASPMIASYLTYYVIKPEGRTNYGALIDPRSHPIPTLGAKTLDGRPAELDTFKGKWILLQADEAACGLDCKEKLHDMRQLRLAQGKEMSRLERVWLLTDDQPLETVLMREYDGTHMLRVNADTLKKWLPTEEATGVHDHLYLIDPLGNLMMRFPKDADPNKIKKDLSKLLKASRIG